MSTPDTAVLVGRIVEEEIEFSLEELSGACAVEQRVLVEWLHEGVIETRAGAAGGGSAGLRFGGDALRRARLALRLQQDLGLNAAGAALAIELLDRIDDLERRLSLKG